jgi:hypothetical protein
MSVKAMTSKIKTKEEEETVKGRRQQVPHTLHYL